MTRKFVTPLILVFALACAGPVLADPLPTEHQVYEAARTNHLADAERMINQVLEERPNSAKAHYAAAEVYARAHDFSRARQELNRAEQLEPGLPFAPRDAVRALQLELSQGGGGTIHLLPGSSPAKSSIPWMPILIIALVVGVLWAVLRRRSSPAVYPQYSGASPAGVPGPVGTPGVGVPGAGPVVGGSGIMGSLATGLAVGAGVAAGEELVRHVLEPDRREGYVPPPPVSENNENSDMGGKDFGISDPSSWDDDSGSFGGDSGGGGGGDDWT